MICDPIVRNVVMSECTRMCGLPLHVHRVVLLSKLKKHCQSQASTQPSKDQVKDKIRTNRRWHNEFFFLP
jgi:hypothetical protein